jgi:hypothetical protein
MKGNTMASTGLGHKSYSLSSEIIALMVEDGRIGNYVAGNMNSKGVFVPKYTGRSDNCVKERVEELIGKYSHFKFAYASYAKQAFEKECTIYHDFEKQLDNEIHPDRPNETTHSCPRCNHFLTGRRVLIRFVRQKS